ncbi:MAG TPA: tetratricopeptide repeat protein [Verrucomicrobiae bacterium]|jgi:tetratricopeptide (TPR) repeat protein|nr:tetratricopeptide repeat protein [Verrucomicrobiae bacterium]
MPLNAPRLFKALAVLAFVLGARALPAAAMASDDVMLFERANEAFRQNHFKEAADMYRKLQHQYPTAAVFSYDLGNSLFKDGDLGGAILAYERAKLKAPRDPDVRHNLDYANSLLEYHVDDKRNWYVKAGEEVLNYFREKETNLLLFAAAFLFLSSWIFSLNYRRGEPWGWFRKTLLAFLSVGLVLAGGKSVETHMMRDAIVTAKEAEVRFGPSLDSQVSFRLGQGLKAYVVDTRKDWSRVLLVNLESGWVQNKDIEEVSKLS